MNGLTPRQLVAACRRSSPEAWQQVLDRYGRLIYAICVRSGLDSQDTEEVFQRTWIAVVEGVHRISKPSSLGSWIAGVTRNQIRQYFTEKQRNRRYSSLEVNDISKAEESATTDAEQELLACESNEALYLSLAELDDRCRSLLQLLFLEDPAPDYREISRRTGLAIGSIGPIRSRCLTRLRKIFTRLYQPSEKSD